MKIQSAKSIFIKDFTVGDVVYVYTPAVKLHTSKKLPMLWTGPYLLVQKVSDVLFKMRRLSDHKLVKVPVHVNRFKQATLSRERPSNLVPPDLPVGPNEMTPDLNESDIP